MQTDRTKTRQAVRPGGQMGTLGRGATGDGYSPIIGDTGANCQPVQQRRTVVDAVFIPAQLEARQQWVCWRYEERDGRLTKVPVNPRTGGNASSTDPATWATVDAALDHYQANGRFVSGVGYVLAPGDDVIGIDLDHCIDDGTPAPWAAAIVAKVDSYTEVSPSGEGLRIFCRGRLPDGGRKRGNIEMYSEGRYLTFTGNHLPGTPLEVNERQAAIDALHAEVFAARKPATAQTAPAQPVNLDDAALLAKARSAKDGALFSALWNGDTSGYPSTSEADLALCNLLAFWTGNDAARVDRLFRQSGLMRDKWNARHARDGKTYGKMTIAKATDRADVYTPNTPAAAHVNENGNGTPAAVNWQPASRKTIWTTPELLSTEFPEPRWAVPGLVPVGLSFLAGRPKIGKSWLALQFAIAIGSGGKVFGEDVERRKVLYLALEDSERRIKDRAQKQGIPDTAAVTWATEWATMDAGGGDAVMNAVQAGGFGLVIIDTLSRFLGSGDQQNLSAMTMLLGGLQRLALAADVAVLLVDHHRKAGALGADVIDDLLGSTGKAAVADAVLGLYKVQGRKGAQLAITGRDVEERTLALEWDALTCCWQCLGDADDVQKDTVQGAILAAIAELVQLGQLPTSTTIAEHLSQKKQNVNRALLALVTGGQVIRGPKQGREQPYYLPAQVIDLNA